LKMVVLVDKTGNIIESHNYDIQDFIQNTYSQFCSLKTEDGLVVGDVHPELIWQEIK
jgi:hypothetical protein